VAVAIIVTDPVIFDRRYRLSASVGGAVYESSRPETVEALLAKADALMYEQKRRRRNGLLLSMPVGPPTLGAREQRG